MRSPSSSRDGGLIFSREVPPSEIRNQLVCHNGTSGSVSPRISQHTKSNKPLSGVKELTSAPHGSCVGGELSGVPSSSHCTAKGLTTTVRVVQTEWSRSCLCNFSPPPPPALHLSAQGEHLPRQLDAVYVAKRILFGHRVMESSNPLPIEKALVSGDGLGPQRGRGLQAPQGPRRVSTP